MTSVIRTIADWRAESKRLLNATVGFVPTMGALHAGHQSLVERSLRENDVTVVSIFVNPTQFNDKSDFERYPRNDAQDIELLKKLGVHYVFMPGYQDLYPEGFTVRVVENEISRVMEGASRPGHFDGVLTVVMKLLSIVRPYRAYFGEKDYQQFLLIKKMADAFFLPVEIIPCTTIRDADGLALSSRNVLLSTEERAKAALFPQILKTSATVILAAQKLEQAGFSVDYVEEAWDRRFGAVRLGKVRLIDNFPLASIIKP
ncbi:MAG: pantoate--beta-alanine ligase [Cyclobacteriaceae bacterium]|nr:pantoate--beta-alanine ligase [Cyclobacteriaceae bacterium]MCX7637000.1 pantoate--beta-alanine ligase [Cyclobacteriaceae bacterium]MDW8330123.1 pantoate--beta-alanine ligase [Cyclobacteriaceae bacterium]